MRFEQLRKKTTIKKEVKIYYWHIYGIIRLSSGSRQMDPKMIEIEEQKTFSYDDIGMLQNLKITAHFIPSERDCRI